LDQVISIEPMRVFIPSICRMITMHTSVIVAFSLLGWFLSLLVGILDIWPMDIMTATALLLVFDISALIFFTLFYGLNSELFSIKIDAGSVTGPCRFYSRSILRSEIDPARSMRRNLIDILMRHWHIRDARGKGISISGLDFHPDEIAEILKTIGLEPK
jgi:hypothetical protein